LPKVFARKTGTKARSKKGPLVVGLLNGLMPCGPLQAMQLYALYTGSPVKGALSMLAFSLGTAPLMFGLGAFGSLMSRRFAGRLMKAGAVLVMAMGVVMANNGAALSGFGSPSDAGEAGGIVSEITLPGNSRPAQNVVSNLTKYGRYQPITVKAGSPVRLNIHADPGTINGCNNAIVIPAFNLQKKLTVGDNIIEFTPTKPGVYRYSCWMGMIRSTITVVEDDSPEAAAAGQSALPIPGAAEAAEIPDEDDSAFTGQANCCGAASGSAVDPNEGGVNSYLSRRGCCM
jgi:hypothetical protein